MGCTSRWLIITHPTVVLQEQSLKELDDDLAVLTKYLKTGGVPKAAINVLETLKREQQDSWETAIDKITELLDDR